MARSNRGATLLFWLMFLAGGTALFACLFLPLRLEVRTLRRAHALAQQRIVELEEDLTRVAKQVEYLRDDPAYLERIGHREFGIEPPGVEIVWIETPENPTTQPTSASALANNERREQLATGIEQATRTSPFVSVFVLDETRPIVMAMSGVVVVVALVLLLRGGASKPL